MDSFERRGSDDELTVLLVEDDPVYATWLKENLQRQADERGVDLVLLHAMSLSDLAALPSRNRIDVAICDLELTDSQGVATLDAVQRQLWLVPLVVMSGQLPDQLRLTPAAYGVAASIDKGKEVGDLLGLLCRVRDLREVAERRQQRQLRDRYWAWQEAEYLLARSMAFELNTLCQIVLQAREVDDAESGAQAVEQLVRLARRFGIIAQAPTGQRAVLGSASVQLIMNVVRPILEHDGVQLLCDASDDQSSSVVFHCRGFVLNRMLLGLVALARADVQDVLDKRLLVGLRLRPDGLGEVALTVTGARGAAQPSRGRVIDSLLEDLCALAVGEGGCLEVYTMPGSNTTYQLVLPVVEEGNRVPSEHEIDAFPLLRERSILVADDEEPIREGLRAGLEGLGARVQTAANGAQALATLDKHGFDLLIVDVAMPVMDGKVFLASVRELYGELPPTIVSTGWLSADEEVQLRQLGVDEVIHKPYELDDLVAAIARVDRNMG